VPQSRTGRLLRSSPNGRSAVELQSNRTLVVTSALLETNDTKLSAKNKCRAQFKDSLYCTQGARGVASWGWFCINLRYRINRQTAHVYLLECGKSANADEIWRGDGMSCRYADSWNSCTPDGCDISYDSNSAVVDLGRRRSVEPLANRVSSDSRSDCGAVCDERSCLLSSLGCSTQQPNNTIHWQ